LLRTPRGMRDFPPKEKRQREWVIGRICSIFESYGYEPIETPAMELFEVLQGKLGEESDQLLFKILRRGTPLEDLRRGKVSAVSFKDFDEVVDSALRFDLTVPFARFLAMHRNLPRPFKRYQIQPVWRAERQQRGRFREFYQCDVDVAGSESMLADAEIVSIVVETLLDLGFTEFQTHIGHRKILDALVEAAGGQAHARDICCAIDKFDKIGMAGVREEMSNRGIPKGIADDILKRAAIEGSVEEVISHLERTLSGTVHGPQGITETRELFEILEAMGVPSQRLVLDLRLVRGLDYYTGPVYESIVTTPAIGSLTGGGRYDELIGRFTGQPIPAVGTTIGLERIIEVMKEFSMFPEVLTGTEVLVTIFDASTRNDSLAIANELRRAGIRCEVSLQRPKGLKRQISYASSKEIPLIAVIGPDEIAAGEVTLRAGPKKQRKVKRAEVGKEARLFLESLREDRTGGGMS
ncbi:MAG: histidine--tRNA ligase, partial [Candidatus Eisenbacteria sp.]|nr:histidine--tRNA ligase [Candidatus Eisenbacteria bacterium]